MDSLLIRKEPQSACRYEAWTKRIQQDYEQYVPYLGFELKVVLLRFNQGESIRVR